VAAQTELRADNGPISIGSLAEVKGATQTDGSVAATRVRIQEGPAAPSNPSPLPAPQPGQQTAQPQQLEGLTGVVQAAPSGGFIGDWKISGRVVAISSSTKVEQARGALAVGALVEVKGVAKAGGALDATKVEVKAGAVPTVPQPAQPAEVTGTVQFLPADIHSGDWIVGGNTVRVVASTLINTEKGVPAIGSTVQVHGLMSAAGVIAATSIEVKTSASAVVPMTLTAVLGAVRSRPTQNGEGEWRINEMTVHVNSDTVIDSSSGSIGVGAVVEVSGWQDSDKSIHAQALSSHPEAPEDHPEARLARFTGQVSEDFGVDQGKVDDRLVRLTSGTAVETDRSSLTAGTKVEVHGFRLDDGSFQATKVEVLPAAPSAAQPSLAEKHVGEVESAASPDREGAWQVGGRAVRVSSGTRFQQARGSVSVGASVEVRGWLHPDGFIEATEIEVISGKK
jgi:hypothetical protein